MQRRTWLGLGVGSALLLAVGGGSLALLTPGLRQGRLTQEGRAIFAAAARALLAGVLPSEGGAQLTTTAALLDRIDGLIANLPPHGQAELSDLLALLASSPGRVAFAGLSGPWHDAGVAEIQAALDGMRVSRVSLRQQGYQALHDIVGAAYFSEPATWGLLGYPGPTAV